MSIKLPELLAPAGTYECLETAFNFGADAVYIAGKSFGLRAFAQNFSTEEIKRACGQAHENGKRIYVTVNSLIHNNQFDDLLIYLKELECAGVDAIIISDPGIITLVSENDIHLNIHLSTQANTFNYKSAEFWHKQGVSRIVLSRELTLDEIKEITSKKPESLSIETFVHGAMCVAHSGRCLMSNVLTGRSGNKGECAQPCRWEYYIHEKGYKNDYFPISEDENGTYILNSKDLMMIEYIDQLCKAGISSFKIEGRMKSPYYVASVVNAYRQAMDEYAEKGDSYVFNERYRDELIKSASRQFCTGFYFGHPEQDTEKDLSMYRQFAFVGIVKEDSVEGIAKVEQRNKFCVGDRLEVLSPGIQDKTFEVVEIRNAEGELQDSAPHPQQIVFLKVSCPLRKGDILRKLYD